MKAFKLNRDGQHDLTANELNDFDTATFGLEHALADYGANARSLSGEVRKLRIALETERAKVTRLNDAIRLWGETGETGHLTEAIEPEEGS